MGAEAVPAADDPDVAYLTFQPETGDPVVATLVRRRRLGGWRIHALGDQVRPEHVPHDR
jgi:hypothetical protein